MTTIIEALEGSVRKWALIAHGLGVDERAQNCPLCRTFLDDCFNNDIDAWCPVANKTGFGDCDATPYKYWSKHQRTFHHPYPGYHEYQIECPICRSLAQQELMFLQGILEEHLAAAREARNEGH